MNRRSLRLIALLPFSVLGAVACGGSAFDSGGKGAGGTGAVAGSSVFAGSGNLGGSGSAAGSGNVAGSSSAGSTSIGGTGNVGGGYGTGGNAGLDIQACTSNSDCEIEPTSCCGCGSDPASNFTAINSKYQSQYESRCGAVGCAGCPPVADDPRTAYYVATCQASQCVVVDLHTMDITACTTAADCSLRSGTACCSGCGENMVSLNTDRASELSTLVCGSAPTACPACAPTNAGYSTGCSDGRCTVVLGGNCTEANPCPL
jgi:hypothetical protein